MTEPLPDLPTAPRRGVWDRVSVVWLVPLAALAVAVAVAWQSFNETGPLVEIVFDDAAGVVARETELRYRNVAVGLVEKVRFTAGLEQVVVSVRVEPEVAPFLDADARFWVVRPRISTQQITGLETVLSGVYIEGVWDTRPGEPQDRFEGLDDAPLLGAGQEGLEFTLFASDGTLTSAMPLLYRGVVAGQTGEPRLAEDGITVEADAVIYAPFDRLVTRGTKFWDASGFRISLGSTGAEVDYDALSSLLMGGLAFDTFDSGRPVAQDGDRFRAFYSEDLARDSLVADVDTPSLELSAVFSGGPIAGLVEGSAVTLDGLRVGDVTSVRAVVDPERFGDEEIHLQASFEVQPSRLGFDGEGGPDAILAWLDARVGEGLRARLATGSLLGGLKIDLVEVPGVEPAAIDRDAMPYPALPVTAATVTDLAGETQDVIARINALPIEELMGSATAFLDSAGVLVGSADAQAVPGEIRGLLQDIRTVTASEEVQALPADLREALARVEGAAGGLDTLLAQVEEQDGVARALATVDRAGEAAAAVTASAEGVPALVARLDAVAAKAEALQVEPILTQARALVTDARGLLADPALRSLPASAQGLSEDARSTLAELEGLLADTRATELPQRLASALDAAREAASTIDTAVEGVPQLIQRIDAVAARAETIDVQPLLDQLTGLSTEARTLLAQPGLQELPARLGTLSEEATAALADARALLGDIEGEELSARLSAALSAAEDAARGVEASVTGVPDLVARIDAVAARAESLPLEELVTEVTGLASAAEALVASPGAQALPQDLSTALAEVEAILREAREGDVVGNLNATLASARQAADSLPTLVARASGLLDQASSTLSGFDQTSSIVREAQDAIRDVAAAADAVAALARTIERDPNSLLFGR